jgi:hypothetical protein
VTALPSQMLDAERAGNLDCEMEFLNGRPLSPEELEHLRIEIESFDDISAVSDEVRGIVRRNWPQLLSKLPPEE